MGKKGRRTRHATDAPVAIRTAEQRQEECSRIQTKLQELGLSCEIAPVAEFYAIMQDYVQTGQARSGEIKLPGLKRVLCYSLSTRCHVACAVNLKFDPSLA